MNLACLPVSPIDSNFKAFCQRQQIKYIAAENWRYRQAMKIPAWTRGDEPSNINAAYWKALDLHPQSRVELQARLDQLENMETEALQDSDWLNWTAEFAAMITNKAMES